MEQVGNIQLAFIYGSYAKGKENYLSDIDLVIIGNPDEDELIKKLDRLEEKLQREINYKLYKLKELTKIESLGNTGMHPDSRLRACNRDSPR